MSAKQYRFFGQVQEVNDKGETIDAGWSCLAKWVQYSDYARLKAEVERLKFTLEEERQITRQDWAGLRCEHDRVKRALEQAEAEVERLTKLCQATSPDGFIHIRDIKAAKGGQQS